MFINITRFYSKTILLSAIFLPIILFIFFSFSIKELNATNTIDKDVSVMYAGSLVNIFENEIKSVFEGNLSALGTQTEDKKSGIKAKLTIEKKLSEIKNESIENIQNITTKNAKELFSI